MYYLGRPWADYQTEAECESYTACCCLAVAVLRARRIAESEIETWSG